MSIDPETSNIDWLEKSISDEYFIEFSDFSNLQLIGNGSFGSVWRANWKNRYYALKSFNDDTITLKKVVKEIKLHKKVDLHENIIRFFGITREITANSIHQINKYSLVLEYADGGTLNAYLTKHFNELNWNDKYQLALQLSSAVEFIHDCDIVHFLMWQISSGYQPFKNVKYDENLTLSILNDKREEIIYGTPPEYSNLYQECWKYETENRPNMEKVILILKTIISFENSEIINASLIEEIELPIKSKSSKSIKEIDEDLENLEISENFNFYNDNENCSKLQSIQSFQSNLTDLKNISLINLSKNNNLESIIEIDEDLDDLEISEDIAHYDNASLKSKKSFQSDVPNFKINFSSSLYTVNNSSKNSIDLIFINHTTVDRLIKLVIKKHNEDADIIEAVKLFLKAAEKNCSISQVYLTKCYYNGYEIKCDKNLSFNWYKKSVENGSIIGQLYLGHCYEYGIGTKQNETKA
ncbi:6533_t:CDS:2, partial [Funneliformis geosporum]